VPEKFLRDIYHFAARGEDTEESVNRRRTKKNGQKDKQRATKHTHKTKDRVTRTPLKTGGELRCSGRV